ncbi:MULTISPECIES: DUF378 domain-containing protein [unclassified Clostridium]|uniref:DUF378 domain-containing protein n=1 Tax=unclassified Clostridium TaxID=2614128 RepID=UPI00023AF261|nr:MULTISPECIES: DUF378 domain-containing protein [unclassified Clostridium]EHI98260.1 protein of unknown function DUF378 [Clostridium sp. DL-VIII]OOM77662.1 hypothetical protein CLOBL_28030 [Clostridium sp. BL-8]
MKLLDTIVLILVIIGGINWGLVGLFQFNLVDSIFGTLSLLSRIIYSLVGIASIYSISFFMKERAH